VTDVIAASQPPKADPLRLLFLLPSIRGGGMERLASILARGLDPARFTVEIVVLHRRNENADVRASLPARIPVISLDKRGRLDGVRIIPRLAGLLRRRRPDVAIGFMTYPNLLLLAAGWLLRGAAPPVIATEHVTPDALRATRGKRLQLTLARRLYSRAAAVVAVSEGLRGALLRDLDLAKSLVTTIYNPFDPELDALAADDERPHPWLESGDPTLVAVGRLAPQKAYPNLLRALALVRRRRPARLLILGDGEERSALERLRDELGLGDAVEFLGYVANPFPYMRDAAAFVLASDWETLGFVLVEASRVGAAIVATDCEFGPNEIVDDGHTGLLVPPRDPEALAAAIGRVLDDPELAGALRSGARSRSAAFAPDEAIRRYAELVVEVAGR
jgi:glycosyltransferase involved in cell wall biosynthesis